METKKIPNSQVKSLSCVQLFATPWTAAHQAPLSMGFSNPEKEHWSWCNQVPWLQTILQNYSHQNSNSSVQLGHSVVSWLFVTSWTAAHQTSLSITNSWSLLKPMSIESVMPSNHSPSVVPFSSCLQSFPESGSFPGSWFFASGGKSIGASASTSVLPVNIQGWFPLGLTALISLQSKGLLRTTCINAVKKLKQSFT